MHVHYCPNFAITGVVQAWTCLPFHAFHDIHCHRRPWAKCSNFVKVSKFFFSSKANFYRISTKKNKFRTFQVSIASSHLKWEVQNEKQNSMTKTVFLHTETFQFSIHYFQLCKQFSKLIIVTNVMTSYWNQLNWYSIDFLKRIAHYHFNQKTFLK